MPSPGISANGAPAASSSDPGRPAPPLLVVDRLSVTLPFAGGQRHRVVDEVSFTLPKGETLGLVGESGSGKSMTALALIRLVPPPGRIGGRIALNGADLLALGEAEMRRIRGAEIGFVFQEPGAALSPVMTVGDQVAESLVVHGRADWTTARARAVGLLSALRIPDAAARAQDYPHHLSGGLQQRVMLAVALACDPELLVADEPTTALDVTVQAEVLDLIGEQQAARGLGVLLITHDLGVVAGRATRVAVMYAGRIVEQAPVGAIFSSPRHPYTQALLSSIPGGATGTRLRVIDGHVPAPDDKPAGCAFAPRCAARMDQCLVGPPSTVSAGPGHAVACCLHGSEPEASDAAR